MLHALLLIAALSTAPVHVALRPAVAVTATADGFVTLGSVADLTGGEAAARARLSAVVVARAPLPGDVRQLTRGDLFLKLRQAGYDPSRVAVLEGAPSSDLTAGALAPVAAAPVPTPILASSSATSPVAAARPEAPLVVVKRGDSVSIQIQDGALAITAAGVARDNGGVGDTIRVHREGVMTDLTVRVVDAQTVQLEL